MGIAYNAKIGGEYADIIAWVYILSWVNLASFILNGWFQFEGHELVLSVDKNEPQKLGFGLELS